MILDEKEYLAHYGTPRHSGRYPWGSGDNENTRNKDIIDYIEDMKSQGLTDQQIMDGLGIKSTEYRARKSNARAERKAADHATVHRLNDKGMSPAAISKQTGIADSTVRSLLKEGAADKLNIRTATVATLKKEVDQHTYIDVGKGTSNRMGVTQNNLDNALAVLKEQGYSVHPVNIAQVTTEHDTRFKVLVPPGVTQRDLFLNQDKIVVPGGWSDDGGRTYSEIKPALAIKPSRVAVRYKEEGGATADGVIYVRRGVDDISLGGNNYAQVRVQVGPDRYLKGMAMYKDDLPAGVDLMFNTNKSDTGNKLDAMKKNSDNPPDLPFGSIISRQILDNPGHPDAKPTSVMNLVNEEGKWDEWSRSLSSQMLSKQSPTLAKTQLDMTYEHRQDTFEDISKLTNPTVKKKLLEEFADGTDAASVHLQAAQMPRQRVAVLLPVDSIKRTEVYAPSFENGERVVLVRHPHGGTFEIPELVVNNRNREAKKIFGDESKDAIGIHHTVAEWLSGADFDGDTVLVIPNNAGRVTHSAVLQDLKGFDPKAMYPKHEGMKVMSNTQTEMGKISNLITDMTIKNASHAEIARAVRHSMVVIDAEKHELNYKQSYIDNNIKGLKDKYQLQPGAGKGGKDKHGAATLISRARSDVRVDQRKPRSHAKGGPVDKVTGEKRYELTGRPNHKTGELRKTKTTRMAEARDAHELSSGTPMENLYANHANKLKALANQARLAALNTPRAESNPSAKKVYAPQVSSLDAKLHIAKQGAPLERQAQIIARSNLKAIKHDNPNQDEEVTKKVRAVTLDNARARTGAKKHQIDITQDEWDAIQAGAISDTKLSEILKHADMDKVRALATPPQRLLMTSAKTARAQDMLAMGFPRVDVAKALGVSLSTLDKTMKEKG